MARLIGFRSRLLLLSSVFTAASYAAPICGFALNGSNWVNSCSPDVHHMSSTAFVTGVLDGNPFTLTLSGVVSVWTGQGSGGSLQDEIYDMMLTAPGVTMIAGDGTPGGTVTPGARQSLFSSGNIVQQLNGQWADSFFDVFFEIDLSGIGGPLLHNNSAQQTQSVTDQLPPPAGTRYGDPPGAWPPIRTRLYDTMNQLRGEIWATPLSEGGQLGGPHMTIEPEPGTWLLLASALITLGCLRSRRSA